LLLAWHLGAGSERESRGQQAWAPRGIVQILSLPTWISKEQQSATATLSSTFSPHQNITFVEFTPTRVSTHPLCLRFGSYSCDSGVLTPPAGFSAVMLTTRLACIISALLFPCRRLLVDPSRRDPLLPDPVSAYLSNNSYDTDSIPPGFCLIPLAACGPQKVFCQDDFRGRGGEAEAKVTICWDSEVKR
jgi:hypothetical protein